MRVPPLMYFSLATPIVLSIIAMRYENNMLL